MSLSDWLLKRSMPARCFISHSFEEADLVKAMIETLPKHVSPFIFPKIDVPPDHRVSDDLVAELLRSPGLIHLTSPLSARSEWVSFERDFALRLGRKVYACDPRDGLLRRDKFRPRELRIHLSFALQDADRVAAVFRFMKTERSFDVSNRELVAGTDFRRVFEDGLSHQLERGGYAAVFLSQQALRHKYFNEELAHAVNRWPDRLLFVLLEQVPEWQPPLVIRHRLPVKLYVDRRPGLNWNGVDDLIVRIHHLLQGKMLRHRQHE